MLVYWNIAGVTVPVSPPIQKAKKRKPPKTLIVRWFFVFCKCRKKQKKAPFRWTIRWTKTSTLPSPPN